MLTLLKDIECYSPQYLGKKDILISYNKIFKILEPNQIENNSLINTVINCDGLLAFPGIVDQHVHIIGGGGEQGFASRIPEIDINDILIAGVTTVVGVLGVDSYTRSLHNLLAKARALDILGITAYIYTGSYAVPTVPLTGSVANDIVLIDKIIGTGEIAISDHRSSVPQIHELIKLASETHIGGLISKKAGVFHIHVGDGKKGLSPLKDILANSELTIKEFVPTHVNRNEELFKEAIDYCKNGGNIDLTAGQAGHGDGITVPNAIKRIIDLNIDTQNVTVTSDANGSIPNGSVGKIQELYNDIISCIKDKDINPEIAFSLVTQNAAQNLKLYPQKGTLLEGSDADILITDKTYKIIKLFCLGKLKLDNGKPIISS